MRDFGELSRILTEAIQSDSLIAIDLFGVNGNEQWKLYPESIDPVSRTLSGFSEDRHERIVISLSEVLDICTVA